MLSGALLFPYSRIIQARRQPPYYPEEPFLCFSESRVDCQLKRLGSESARMDAIWNFTFRPLPAVTWNPATQGFHHAFFSARFTPQKHHSGRQFHPLVPKNLPLVLKTQGILRNDPLWDPEFGPFPPKIWSQKGHFLSGNRL